MRLTQLQLKGFKSFADETVINFNEQVIGIVGPNGSGKSNIIDAIKWVLGEQKTSELRLEAMQDVLFNGTKDRKEGKVARVSLHFKNTKNILPTEYNDVTITRILYRNGQSEYRLNDVQCRKKDITSLFLDSGMGSNSYAIISLSMVEDILVDKDNSRGKMIEEASGINKYKVRKKETLNKLKGTQTDLDRIEDLLFELEANLKAFEKQARRTERYLKVKEEFKTVSLSWAARSTIQVQNEQTDLRQKLEDEIARENAISSELNIKEAELQNIKKDILGKEGKLSQFQRTHNELKNRIQSIENKKGIAQNELKYLKDAIRKIDDEQKKLTAELKELKYDLNLKKEEKKKEKAFIEDIQGIWEEKNSQYESIKEIYDTLRADLVSGQSTRQKLSEELENTTREISAKESQITLLSSQLVSRHTEIREINLVIDQVTEEIKDLKSQVDIRSQELSEKLFKKEECERKSKVLENEKSEIEEQLKKIDLQKAKVEQRIELLRNVIENYEGFAESVQFLNREKKLDHPVLTDIIDIKDPRYKDILEMYFHNYLQHLVVDSMDDALKLNTLVREAQKGKVSFLIQREMENQMGTSPHDDLIPIIDLIQFDERYRPVIEFVTKDAYICEESFSEISLDGVGQNTTILFPENHFIYTSGELKGGSISLFEGVNLGRRQNLSELERSLSNLNSKSSEFKISKLDFEKELESIKKEIFDLNPEIQESKSKLESLNNQIVSKSSELKYKETRKEELGNTVSSAEAHIRGMRDDIAELKKKKESFSLEEVDESELEKKRIDFDKYHVEFETIRDEREDINQTLIHSRNNLSLTERDISVLERSIKEKQDQQKENEKRKKDDQQRLEGLTHDIEQLEKQVFELYENEKKQFAELNSHEEDYFQAKSGIYDKEKHIYELRGKRDKLNHLISSIKEKISEKNQLLTSYKDRAEVEFHVDITKYSIPEEWEEMPLPELGDKRDTLSNRLRSFGDINPLAIEAYNEIEQRVKKIIEERDDILLAKQNLEETIADIEDKASKLFTDALDQIRFHFKEVFRSLFSEDDACDIVLLNADNPLESSIEIMAKPKGKKPKSINQLSGGEKTLTAVSFLFALYLIKPAPFCIFDEVDAPLDDVNIQKFNNIIRTFSKGSQFIIVTHNKATMAEMDILYGVFMREHGVSGVTAVDFRNFKKVDLFSQVGSNAN